MDTTAALARRFELVTETYPPEINGVSGEYLCANGISTFACSEVGTVQDGR